MKNFRKIILGTIAFAALAFNAPAQRTSPDAEMRSAWIATVYALDWPGTTRVSSTGNTAQINTQKKALTTLLDSMAINNMNAAKLQIRSRADAMYKSSYEPWSSDLVSRRGLDPGYDPFAFFIEECHKRGMEAHAWVNPYRYESSLGTWTGTPHAYRDEHPDWLIDYNNQSILNPSLPEVRQRICDIIREIVTNYDLDGLLFDDYFYLQGTPASADIDLYNAYKKSGGSLTHGDWRRENVNMMIADVNRTIKEIKPWVRFGVSPAGLTCTGADVAATHGVPVMGTGGEYQYDGIFSDPLAWYEQKSLDYISPQIYWGIGYASADYKIASKWWSDRAPEYGRHMFVSHDICALTAQSKAPIMKASGPNVTTFGEYTDEVEMLRDYCLDGAPGSVYYRAAFFYDVAPLFGHHMLNTVYGRKALLPAITWFPAAPQGLVNGLSLSGSTLSWTPVQGMRYAVYATDPATTDDILLGMTYEPKMTVPAKYLAYKLSVSIVDRYSNVYSRRTLGQTPVTLAAPKLVAPVKEAVAECPFEFEWAAVDGAESYILEVGSDAAMSDLLATRRIYGATALAVSELEGLPLNGRLYWRVRACADNATGNASATESFNIYTLVITEPVANATGVALAPEIKWNDSDREVTIEISTDQRFSDIVYSQKAKGGSLTTPANTLLPLTNYWVRAVYDREGKTYVSGSVRFMTCAVEPQIPEIAEPVDGGILYADRSISVKPVTGATRIRVEVSATDKFPPRTSYITEDVSTSTFTDSKKGSEIKLRTTPLADGKSYYARARADFKTQEGMVSTDYSPTIQFVYSAENASVDNVIADGEAFTVTIDGLAVQITDIEGTAELYNTAGICIDRATGTSVTLHAPSAGVYVVKCGQHSVKVTLR